MSKESFSFSVCLPYRGLPKELFELIFRHIDPETFLCSRKACKFFHNLLSIGWYCEHFVKHVYVGTQPGRYHPPEYEDRDYYVLPNDKKHGLYRCTLTTQGHSLSISYKKGMMDGDYILSDPAGSYSECIPYTEDKRDGWATIWPETDQSVYVMSLYIKGRHVKNMTYRGSDKMTESYYNEHGKLHGPLTIFSERTKGVLVQYMYCNGIRHGECKKFDGRGKLISTIMMEEGKPVWRIQWWPNGNIQSVLPVSEAKEGRSYYSSGELRSIKSYDSSLRRDGPYTIFHKRGFILETGVFRHAVRCEVRTIYGFDGKPKMWQIYGNHGVLIRTDTWHVKRRHFC